MGERLENLIDNIFYKVQFKKTCHKKNMEKLLKLYNQYGHSEFWEPFIGCLRVPLSIGQRHLYIENTLEFAATFVVSFCSFENNEEKFMSPILSAMFDFLLKSHSAKDPSVRFRICHFLNIILNSMGDQAFLDDTLCDKITCSMMERLLDKSSKVRAQAVFALHRLQDPLDENCQVIKMYIFHLSKDPKAEVRKAVLVSMAKNQTTLNAALKRIRDVDSIVRKMAYEFFNKITLRSLSIKHRNQLLYEGLNDRSETVRKYVETVLLPTWLRHYNGSYFDLLKALDVEMNPNNCILLLNTFFKSAELETLLNNLPIDENTKLIPISKLTGENVLYWRCLVEHLHNMSCTDVLETIVPELSTFCTYVYEYVSYISESQVDTWITQTQNFVLLQLCEITKTYDLSDEVGRQKLNELILNLLLIDRCTNEIIESTVKYLASVMPDPNKRSEALADVINKIRLPQSAEVEVVKITPEQEHENNMQKAKMRVKLMELKEEEYQAIKDENYLKAEELKGQIRTLNQELIKLNEQPEPDIMMEEEIQEKSDPVTMSKCLIILNTALKSVTKLTPTLRSFTNIVFPSLDHADDKVYALALETLGVYCLLDKELAKQHILTFLLQFSLDQERHDIWIIALKVIFDFLLRYGLDYFGIVYNENDTTMNKTKKTNTIRLYNEMEEECTIDASTSIESEERNRDLIKILTALMDNADQDLRTIAVEGFCKLLVNQTIRSSSLLSRIIIMYFNPANDEDYYMRQCISSFFELFITKVPFCKEMLEESFFSVLRSICNASEISPLHEIDPYQVARFILSLTRCTSDKSDPNTYNSHNNLASAILTEILNPESKIEADVLIKCLKDLDFNVDDAVKRDNLKKGIEMVLLLVKKSEKRMIKYVEHFQKRLESSESTIEEDVEK